MKDLTTIARKLNVRVLLQGDEKQLDSVEAGTPFQRLIKDKITNYSELNNILRQRDEVIKQAVYDIINKDITESFKKLQKANSIIELRTDDQLNPELNKINYFKDTNLDGIKKDLVDAVVNKYFQYNKDDRANTLIITSTNEIRKQINEKIREQIKLENQQVVKLGIEQIGKLDTKQVDKLDNKQTMEKIESLSTQDLTKSLANSTMDNFKQGPVENQNHIKSVIIETLEQKSLTTQEKKEMNNYNINSTIFFTKANTTIGVEKNVEYRILYLYEPINKNNNSNGNSNVIDSINSNNSNAINIDSINNNNSNNTNSRNIGDSNKNITAGNTNNIIIEDNANNKNIESNNIINNQEHHKKDNIVQESLKIPLKKNEILITDGNKEVIINITKNASNLNIYETVNKELTKNDQIKWTTTDKEKGILKGDNLTVRDIITKETIGKEDKTIKQNEIKEPNDSQTLNQDLNTNRNKEQTTIILFNPKTNKEIVLNTSNNEDKNLLKHIDYNYVSTTYSAQGKTSKNVIYTIESYRPNLTTQKEAYVGLSRTKDNITVITDNINNSVQTLIKNTGNKLGAIDVSKNITDNQEIKINDKLNNTNNVVEDKSIDSNNRNNGIERIRNIELEFD